MRSAIPVLSLSPAHDADRLARRSDAPARGPLRETGSPPVRSSSVITLMRQISSAAALRPASKRRSAGAREASAAAKSSPHLSSVRPLPGSPSTLRRSLPRSQRPDGPLKPMAPSLSSIRQAPMVIGDGWSATDDTDSQHRRCPCRIMLVELPRRPERARGSASRRRSASAGSTVMPRWRDSRSETASPRFGMRYTAREAGPAGTAAQRGLIARRSTCRCQPAWRPVDSR